MRHYILLGVVFVASCIFNPQPDPPGDTQTSGEGGGGTTGAVSGTTTASGTTGFNAGSGGASATTGNGGAGGMDMGLDGGTDAETDGG